MRIENDEDRMGLNDKMKDDEGGLTKLKIHARNREIMGKERGKKREIALLSTRGNLWFVQKALPEKANENENKLKASISYCRLMLLLYLNSMPILLTHPGRDKLSLIHLITSNYTLFLLRKKVSMNM